MTLIKLLQMEAFIQALKTDGKKHVTNSIFPFTTPKKKAVFTFHENEEHRFLGIFQNPQDLEKPYNLLA